MSRFVLIDNHSGFIAFDTGWSDDKTRTPAMACRLFDRTINAETVEYVEHPTTFIPMRGTDAYHVYEIGEHHPEIRDGKSPSTVERVMRYGRKVAVVERREDPAPDPKWDGDRT